ncbi:MAG: hypothetical protein Q7S98_00925 [Deltaproteobacteria bacterium]|nr:hypothetical protein [Deltaproteobacteria bacterium]
MKKQSLISAVVLTLFLFSSSSLLAKEPTAKPKGKTTPKHYTAPKSSKGFHKKQVSNTEDRQGKIEAALGAGLGFNPVQFDIRAEGQYFITNNISAGISLDTLLKHLTLLNISGFGRYHIDLPDMPKLVPYVGMGLGGLIAPETGGSAMTIAVPDIGANYALTDHFFLGSEFFPVIVTDFSGTTWDFIFLFAKVTYRF